MDRVARRFACRGQALRSERGSFLIETLVGAVLVAVVAIAMLSAFDGANQASGRTKIRAIAGSLAQTDQERMRSMPVSMLNNLRQSQVKLVNGVKYNLNSRADWVADDTSTTDCTANGAAADYMEITSTVSSPTQPALRPVVVQSVVTPAPGTLGSNQGSLAVTVVDRRGKGVQGLTVSIVGPVNASDVTDDNGCAFFGYEPIGNYQVSTSRAGWVDIMGRPTVGKAATIASQQISTVQLQYDQAGAAKVTFKTVATDAGVAGTRTVTAPDAVASRIRLSHNLMDPPYVRDGVVPLASNPWGDGAPHTQIVADNLFPFGDMTVTPQLQSPYGVYVGDCDANDPNNQPAAPAPGGPQTVDSVQIEPGKSTDVTVQMPALNINASANVKRIKVRATGAGCAPGPWTYTNADLVNGNFKFPGFPYGTYTVCADDNNGASTRHVTVSVNNYYRAGTAVQPITVTATSPTQACP
jgi:Tfp pilus assembly protein PilV